MLDINSGARNGVIQKPFGETQLLTFGFLFGLEGQNTLRCIPLKACILGQCGIVRILNGFLVRHFFVVGFSVIGLAQIVHPLAMNVSENHVFVGMRFFCHCRYLAVFQHFSDVAVAVRCHQ